MKHLTLGVLYFQASRVWGTFKFYVRNIGKNFFKQEVPFLSSAIAFNILLCFIPLILVLLSIIGTMLLSYDVTIRDVGQFLDSVIPPQPYRSTMKAVVVQIVGDLMANRSSIGRYNPFSSAHKIRMIRTKSAFQVTAVKPVATGGLKREISSRPPAPFVRNCCTSGNADCSAKYVNNSLPLS